MDELHKIEIGTNLNVYEYSKMPKLSKAKKNKLSKEEKKGIEKAARNFEGMFMYLVFKGMRKAMLTNLADDEKNEDFGGDILTDLSLMEVTNHLVKYGKGTGIANMIYKELTGENLMPKEISVQSLETKAKSFPAVERKISTKNYQYLGKVQPLSLEGRISKYNSIIEDTAKKYNLSPALLKSIIAAESAGNPTAISRAGAKGLMQLIDSTAKYVGVNNVFDPAENIDGGAKYLRQMLDTFDGNLELALAAYNAGPSNVVKYNGVPPYKETQSYILRIKRYLSLFQNNE
ncbi:MAG: transglycosylase SLT domain-containing protein [Candidatus Kapaibacteriota bacterium]